MVQDFKTDAKTNREQLGNGVVFLSKPTESNLWLSESTYPQKPNDARKGNGSHGRCKRGFI